MIAPSLPLFIPTPGSGPADNGNTPAGNDPSQGQTSDGMTFAAVLDQSRTQRDAGPQPRSSSSLLHRQDGMKTSAPPAKETSDTPSADASAPENVDPNAGNSAQNTETPDQKTQKGGKQDEPAKSGTASADSKAAAPTAPTVNAAVTLLPLLPVLHAQVPVPTGPQAPVNPASATIGLPVVTAPAASANGAGTEPAAAPVPAVTTPIPSGLPMDPHAAAQAPASGIGNAAVPALPTAQAGKPNLPAAQTAVPAQTAPMPTGTVPNTPAQPVPTATAQSPVLVQAVVAAPQNDKPQNMPSVGVAPVPQQTATTSVPQAVTSSIHSGTTVPVAVEPPVSVSPDTAANHHDQLQRLLTVGAAPIVPTNETAAAPKTPPASHAEVPANPLPATPAANPAPQAQVLAARTPVAVPAAPVNSPAVPTSPTAQTAPTIFAPTASVTDPTLNGTAPNGLPQAVVTAKLPGGESAGEHSTSPGPAPSGTASASSGAAQAIAAAASSGDANAAGHNGSQPHADQGTTQTPTPTVGAENARPTESVSPSASSSPQSGSNVDRAQVIEQVTRQLDTMRMVNGRGEISFRLQPENLGSLRLTITTHENGITAHIVAENAQVRQAVESAKEHLRAALESKGLHLDTLDVSVGQGSVSDPQAGSAGAQGSGEGPGNYLGNPRRHLPHPHATDPIILPPPRGNPHLHESSRLEIQA